jgi:hypothetical protein
VDAIGVADIQRFLVTTELNAVWPDHLRFNPDGYAARRDIVHGWR